ncbi:MAG: PilZ domain-containing protein [Clostridia bacterium]|nr:PilZ domain-containing protein [Clostridia bacterium]
MQIKVGDVVSVRHYSGISPFKSIVVEAGEGVVSVKLSKQFAALNYFEGDPIVLGFEKHSEIYVASCTIEHLSPKDSTVSLKIEDIEFITNKRVYERFPVSFYADVRIKGSRNKSTATVKNISLGGLMICTKKDYHPDEMLEVDVVMDNSTLFLDVSIIRKAEIANGFEYGLKIIYKNLQNQDMMKQYINTLKKEQESFIRELRYS